ncbi:gastrotropin [Scleropages formosus]|nr:gastrotropin [Scleropages formosus]
MGECVFKDRAHVILHLSAGLSSCRISRSTHTHTHHCAFIMAFSGKYEVESQENYDDFLKLIGFPEDVIEKGRDFKIITEVAQNGNEFTWSQVYPTKTMTNKFVIDQECEMETMAGKKFKATVTMEDGKLSVRFPNYHHTVEICGGKLIECSTASGAKGAVTMKKISKRIS